MKLKSLLFLSFILITVCFSCSELSSDTDPINDVSFVGKWEVLVDRYYEDGKVAETYTYSNDAFFDFKSDGKLIITQISKNREDVGTWKKISSSRLIINNWEFDITIISKNEVKIKMIKEYDDEQVEFELKRR
jgi:hypothetical protein